MKILFPTNFPISTFYDERFFYQENFKSFLHIENLMEKWTRLKFLFIETSLNYFFFQLMTFHLRDIIENFNNIFIIYARKV